MVLVSIFMLTLKVVSASAETNSIENASSNEFDWNPVMEAIIQVESGGNRYAKSGSSVGVMQITPICVAECNNILKKGIARSAINYLIDLVFQSLRKCFCFCSQLTILLIV